MAQGPRGGAREGGPPMGSVASVAGLSQAARSFGHPKEPRGGRQKYKSRGRACMPPHGGANRARGVREVQRVFFWLRPPGVWVPAAKKERCVGRVGGEEGRGQGVGKGVQRGHMVGCEGPGKRRARG